MAFEYPCHWTERANGDVDDAVSCMAVELANPQAASRFLEQLDAVLETISCFPDSGALVQNEFFPYSGVRQKPIFNYVLYYLVDHEKKRVNLLRVLYGRRDLVKAWIE